jgi:hypothetical protein
MALQDLSNKFSAMFLAVLIYLQYRHEQMIDYKF